MTMLRVVVFLDVSIDCGGAGLAAVAVGRAVSCRVDVCHAEEDPRIDLYGDLVDVGFD